MQVVGADRDHKEEYRRVFKMFGGGLLTTNEDKVFQTGITSTKKE